ncbi:hypothetical protein D3C75_1188970 [compost metagenome]
MKIKKGIDRVWKLTATFSPAAKTGAVDTMKAVVKAAASARRLKFVFIDSFLTM